MILFLAGNLHGAGSTPGRVLGHGQAGGANPGGELAMRGRIVAVDPTPEHGDGGAAGLERAAVRLAVDAACEAAHDYEPRTPELASEHARDLGAVRRARARADDGDRRAPENIRTGGPANEQSRRRIVDRVQQRRKLPRRTRDPAHARLAQTSQVRSLVEPAREHAKRPLAWRVHDVRARLGRESCERQLAHGAPSSVGDRYASASDRCSAPTAGSAASAAIVSATRLARARPRPESGSRSTARSSSVGRLLRPGCGAPRRAALAPRPRDDAPDRRPRPAGQRARPRAAEASRRRGRSGRAARATACPGTQTAAAAEHLQSAAGSPRAPHGQRFIAATSWKRAGNTARPPTRAMLTTPSSSGCRSASSAGRWNSANSSRTSTPR